MARHTLKLLAAGLGGWLLASSAFAATPAETPSQRVRYTELDLNKDAGVERLYVRLRGAAEHVCGTADLRDLKAFAAQKACVRESLDRAVEAVHSARLSARHRSGTPAVQLAAND
ncbi:MAG: UrcA family protein [Proteobacteria bacterium]|nr:UrcA family protein [Pseudomonadota bacterium]